MKFSRKLYRFRDPLLLPHPFFKEDDGTGGGGGTQSETDKTKTETVTPSEKTETVKTELPHNLTTEELRTQLLTANSRISDLNAECARNRHNAKVSDDDRVELAKYRALGKIEELTTQLDEGKTAKTQNAETRRLGHLDEAAKDLGFKAGLLKRLAPTHEVISKEIDVKGDDGKFTKEKRWFFKNGETETEIEKEFDDETLALLKAEEDKGESKTQNTIQTGRRFVEQGGGGGKPKPKDVTGDYLKNRYARPKTKQE